MKAARLHEYHAPLSLDEVDEPTASGPLDVVVRIGGAGLCRTDIHRAPDGTGSVTQRPVNPESE